MEYFPAMDEEQLSYIKRIIDECDYYILVIAGKYGSLDASGKSYTHLEYEYAKSIGKTVLGFPVRDISKLRLEQTETDPALREKLENFRRELMSGRLIMMWEDQKDLELAVVKSLPAAIKQYPQTGWIRTPKSSAEDLLTEINELRKENGNLKEELLKSSTKPVAAIQGLADLSTNIDFEITRSHRYDRTMSVNTKSLKKTWHEILMTFCLAVKGPVSRDNMKHAVARRFGSHDMYGGRDVPSDIAVRMDDIFFERMLVQLQALGYVQLEKDHNYNMTVAARSFYTEAMVYRE